MKKLILKVSSLALAVVAAVGVSACNDNAKNEAPAAAKTVSNEKAQAVLPNYRYVDLDTVLTKYNLAKDYNEEILRMQTNMESEVKRHENSIQSFANSMQNKMQNNGYLTKESYEADQQKISNMQAQAQRSVASLQSNFENAAINAQKTVNDSIQAFIKDYNAKKGYDAIFMKAATIYINEALDITNEVVEGLNARYNKVKK